MYFCPVLSSNPSDWLTGTSAFDVFEHFNQHSDRETNDRAAVAVLKEEVSSESSGEPTSTNQNIV